MQNSHNVEKASEFAAQAFERMQNESLPPTPENYELWYVYYAQSNPEIVRAIDILVSSDQDVTHERCQDIHERFLSDNSENERVRQAGDKIQSTIKNVNGIVSNVKQATSKYNSTLNDMSGKLESDQGISKENMESMLKDVMSNTKEMMEQNETLEQELSKSSQVMKELQRDLELVRKEALTDGLTNLANRKAFDDEITRIIKESKENSTFFCLLMLDIDHFKNFNDSYGHQVGDQVLRLVAKTLTDGVKGRDFAARYGGEEFIIILPETDLPGAVKVGEYLRNAVANKEVINRNSGEKLGRITLSGGIAQYVPGEKSEDLIERADAALYTAKNNGRNQVAASPVPGQTKAAG